MLDLFPDTATIDDDGGLRVGGVRAGDLAEELGTPVVAYCEQTLRAQARAYADRLGRANARVAACADEVWLVVAGVPLRLR